jgi:hypothetical protein
MDQKRGEPHMRQFIFAFTITIIVGLAIVTILPAAETPVANQTTNELDIVPASGSPVMESVPFQKNAGCDAVNLCRRGNALLKECAHLGIFRKPTQVFLGIR